MPVAAIAEGDSASAASNASDVMQDCHALLPCAPNISAVKTTAMCGIEARHNAGDGQRAATHREAFSVKQLRYNGGQMIPRRLREGLPVDGHQRITRRTAAVPNSRRRRHGGRVSWALEARLVGVCRGLDTFCVQLRRHFPREGGIAALFS